MPEEIFEPDPLNVFRKYEEGVAINEETREVTLSPAVQKDVLDGCAMMMHENRKLKMVLAIVMSALEEPSEEAIMRAKGLVMAMLMAPEEVQMFETDDPEEVKEIMEGLQMVQLDEDDEVKN